MSLNTKKLFTLLITLLIMLQPIAIFSEDTKETKINYEVKAHIGFYIDGVIDDTLTTEISVGDKLTNPGHELREDYIFSNWCTDEDCTTIYDFDLPVSEHMSLYGKYTLISEGDYIIEEDPDSDYDIDNIEIDVKDIPLTEEEIKRIENGEKLHYQLVVKNVLNKKDIDEETKKAIDSQISANKQSVLEYVDIYLVKWFEGDEEKTRIDALQDDATISFTITLPNEYLKKNRTFGLYSKDEGIELSCLDNKITFSLNKFGIHGLAYKDKHHPDPYVPIQTGIDYIDMPITNNPVIRISLCLFLLISLSLTYLYSKKGDKK